MTEPLGFGAEQLSRLIEEVQRHQQQQQSPPGEATATAAKRLRLEGGQTSTQHGGAVAGVISLLDAAGEGRAAQRGWVAPLERLCASRAEPHLKLTNRNTTPVLTP